MNKFARRPQHRQARSRRSRHFGRENEVESVTRLAETSLVGRCTPAEPSRLVFAPRVDYADHLARYCLADLFLDTLPFNAGATASDALWAL
jgi:hypothetical protein